MSYTFLDATASVQTADSSIISGSVQRPVVNIGSILSASPVTFSGTPSISGTVNVGNIPSIAGAVQIAGSSPSSIATVERVDGTLTGSAMGIVTETVIFGETTAAGGGIYIPVKTTPSGRLITESEVEGSVVALQGSTWRTSVISSVPSSMLTGSSIFGQLPAGTAVLGSVAVLQGTNPWNISSVYGNVSGSVLSQQLGTRISSIVGSIPSSTLVGTYGHRNDAVASFLGGNLTWNPVATDSAGRTLIRPFAPEESRVEGYISLTSTSVTTLVAAAGAGLRNYITDAWFANTGASATLVTFKDGAGSILGYTIAPAGSGSNLQGITVPIRTGANTTFDIQAGTATSTLYATVKGFKAP